MGFSRAGAIFPPPFSARATTSSQRSPGFFLKGFFQDHFLPGPPQGETQWGRAAPPPLPRSPLVGVPSADARWWLPAFTASKPGCRNGHGSTGAGSATQPLTHAHTRPSPPLR